MVDLLSHAIYAKESSSERIFETVMNANSTAARRKSFSVPAVTSTYGSELCTNIGKVAHVDKSREMPTMR